MTFFPSRKAFVIGDEVKLKSLDGKSYTQHTVVAVYPDGTVNIGQIGIMPKDTIVDSCRLSLTGVSKRLFDIELRQEVIDEKLSVVIAYIQAQERLKNQ